MEMRGFTRYANAALEDNRLTVKEHDFLTKEFDGARERMTGLAGTVGTAGSVVVALVAVLVGFAAGANEQQDKLTDATNKQALLLQHCGGDTTTPACDATEREQARGEVDKANQRVNQLTDLNKTQAAAGILVTFGFMLALGGVLTNPVPGPESVGRGELSVQAWREAVERLNVKKRWIMGSIAAQSLAIVAIIIVAAKIF
jgi:hypothetical protein